jgi:hypothetical protein
VSTEPINADTVDVMYATVRDLASAEEGRGRSFNERAGTLLGFNGVILALAVALGAIVLRPGLGSVGTPVAAAVLLCAVLATGLGARSCVKVLQPRELWHIGIDYIERLPTMAFVTADATWLKGSLSRAVIRQIADERAANNVKRKYLREAFRWLFLGLGFLAVEVGILALRSIGA